MDGVCVCVCVYVHIALSLSLTHTHASLDTELRGEAFELGVLLRVCSDVCAGVEYIHHQRIVHCDLAARNILMAPPPHRCVWSIALASMHVHIHTHTFIYAYLSNPQAGEDRRLRACAGC